MCPIFLSIAVANVILISLQCVLCVRVYVCVVCVCVFDGFPKPSIVYINDRVLNRRQIATASPAGMANNDANKSGQKNNKNPPDTAHYRGTGAEQQWSEI